jgi:hypothetical protein
LQSGFHKSRVAWLILSRVSELILSRVSELILSRVAVLEGCPELQT